MKPEPSVSSAPRDVGLSVDIEIAEAGWSDVLATPQEDCERVLVTALEFLDYPPRAYEVSVVLGNDASQQILNAKYRGKDAPTNVLSFPSGEDPADAFPGSLALPLGDITLALETMQREAENEGLSLGDHFCHLMVHGMLHLAGYDHETDADAEEMEALEIEILAALGVADPYAAGAKKSQ